jgi:hypothetical protein
MLVFQRIFFNKFSQRLESGNFREKNIYRQPTGRDPESYVGHELYGETHIMYSAVDFLNVLKKYIMYL